MNPRGFGHDIGKKILALDESLKTDTPRKAPGTYLAFGERKETRSSVSRYILFYLSIPVLSRSKSTIDGLAAIGFVMGGVAVLAFLFSFWSRLWKSCGGRA